MRRWALGAVLLVVSSSGCMFFTSLDELSTDYAKTSPGDGGSSTSSSGGKPDATADGSSGDVPHDSGVSTTSPCAGGAHFFCADFESSSDVSTGWTRLNEAGGSGISIERDDTRSASPSHSGRVSVPRRTDGTMNGSFELDIPSSGTSHVRFDADFYIDQPSWQSGDVGSALIVLLFTDASTHIGSVIFNTPTPEKSAISIESSPAAYFDGPPIPYGRWFHIGFDFRTNGTYDFTFDGVSSSHPFAGVALNNPSIQLEIGAVGFNPPVAPLTISVDNVVIDRD